VVQIFILNNIRFAGFMNPYIYVLFILWLPFETPGWLLLLLAFAIGFTIDMFSGIMGMHTAATVLMAFVRPGLLKRIAVRSQYDTGLQPGIQDFGFQWFFSYALVLVLVHHFLLFYLEVFSFRDFLVTLSRVIFSTAFSLVLIFLTEYLFLKAKKS
jgi:rod shape-determining protein MreD